MAPPPIAHSPSCSLQQANEWLGIKVDTYCRSSSPQVTREGDRLSSFTACNKDRKRPRRTSSGGDVKRGGDGGELWYI